MIHAATGGGRRAAAAALVCAALLSAVLAGCVGGAEAEEEQATPACAPETGVTAGEVRFGALYPDTGAGSRHSLAFRAGIDARLGVANADGGVHGRQIHYDWRDDESTSDGARRAARELVERAHSFAVVATSGIAADAMTYLDERGVPIIGQDLTAGGDTAFGYSNILGGDTASSVFGVFARTHGATRAVVLRTDVIATSGQIAERLGSSLAAGSVQVVDTIDWTPVGFDLAAAATRVRAAGADMITGVVPVQAFADITEAIRAAGGPVKVAMLPVGYDPGILAEPRPGLGGAFFLLDFVPFEAGTEAHKRYLDAMVRYAPQIEEPEQTTGLVGWMTADLFLRGLRAAGECPTRAGYIAALRSVRDYDADGLLPAPVDLAAKNAPRACVSVVRVAQTGNRFDVQMPLALCGDTLGT